MNPEKRPLTDAELDYLYQFCAKHYIRYYDVQIELVDHLANATEEMMLLQPALTFEAAVEAVYAGFGKTGFRKIIAAKEAALEKQHKAYYSHALRSYFTLPRILKTACAVALVFLLHRLTAHDMDLRAGTLMAMATGTLLYEMAIPILLYYRHRRPKMELITRQVRQPFYYGIYMFYYPSIQYMFNFIWMQDRALHKAEHYFILLSLLCLLSLLLQLIHKEVSEKIYRKAQQDYPLAYV